MDPNRPALDAEETSFRPPHCPNLDCPFYSPSPAWWPPRDGFYLRPSDQCRFQRFRCSTCHRRFSTRTFRGDYWLRRRHLLVAVAHHCTEGPGLRQSARLLGLSHSTVQRLLSRAARLCLLTMRELLDGARIPEALVVDGFESFEHSQYFPFHVNFAVTSESWLILHFTDSPLRRKGAMTAAQKLRRSEMEASLGRPDPKAVENGILELLRPLASPGRSIRLLTDDHRAYPRAIQRLSREVDGLSIRQEITSSTVRRSTANPLFPANLTDLLLRHGQAGHRRETIAFAKRRQGALERVAIFAVWRNFIKSQREKKPGPTAAMRAGLLDRPLGWPELLEWRRFPRSHLLPGPWWSAYWRQIRTLALGERQTTHNLKYAF